MEELKKKVAAVIAEECLTYLLNGLKEDSMNGLLMAYICYAQEQKQFFRLLHMSDRLGLHETEEFTGIGINKYIVDEMAKETGLSIEGATLL